MDILRRGRRPLPVQQYRVSVERRKYRIDFAYPELREALEWQSDFIHGDPVALQDDSDRTRRLQRAGWRVWPLTSSMSSGELLAIVDEIHACGQQPRREPGILAESDEGAA
jgi:very-short-patch-repair endonuclease